MTIYRRKDMKKNNTKQETDADFNLFLAKRGKTAQGSRNPKNHNYFGVLLGYS